jgi:hypothetical protein
MVFTGWGMRVKQTRIFGALKARSTAQGAALGLNVREIKP